MKLKSSSSDNGDDIELIIDTKLLIAKHEELNLAHNFDYKLSERTQSLGKYYDDLRTNPEVKRENHVNDIKLAKNDDSAGLDANNKKSSFSTWLSINDSAEHTAEKKQKNTVRHDLKM